MAVDYGMLSRIPSVGARFAAGQEAGRAAAAQNMLLQQRAMEFQQAQEDRKMAMDERRMQREAAAAQVARRGQLAQLLRQSGMDPSDMQSATQFYAAALEANEPTAIAAAKDWLSLARGAAEARAAGAEYQGIMGAAPAPAPMATPMAAAPMAMAPAPVAAAAPQELSALAVEQAAQPRPEFYGQGTFAGTAPTAVTSPVGAFPSAPSPANAMAPAAPPVNAMLAPPPAAAPAPAAAPTPAPAKDDAAALRAEAQRLEAQQQRLRQSGFKANQERAKELDKPIERLYKRAEDVEKAAFEGAPMVVGGRLVSRTGKVLYEPPPGAMTPTERFVPVGPNVFNRETGQFLPGPAREPSLRQAPEARVKPAAPIRVRPGEVVISPETGQPIFTAPPAPARAPAAQKEGAKPAEKPATVTEQQASTATQRLLNRATEIADIVQRNRKAEAPTATEAAMENIPYLSRATNLVRSTDRQIVSSAQDDILDALLYLSTGAAYNKEQLQQQKSAYLPSWSDDPPTRQVKRQRLAQAIEGARVRAGRAWTPELDAAMQRLMEVPVMGGRAPAAAPGAAPAAAPAAGAPRRREIAPGVFVTERP